MTQVCAESSRHTRMWKFLVEWRIGVGYDDLLGDDSASSALSFLGIDFMAMTLRWRATVDLPVEAAGLDPGSLTGLSASAVARRPIGVGNGAVAMGELFEIAGDLGDGEIVLEGDLRRMRGIGRGMKAGRLTVRGDVGAELGAEMAGGTIDVEGNVGDWAAAEMRGGTLRVRGDAGRCLGGAYPGSRKGMRDGVILVEGAVGDDVGLAMRRGLIAVSGEAGGGLGRGLIAGSIFAFGTVGRRAGAGMRRGTLALFGLADPSAPGLLPTFAPSGRSRPPILSVYLRQLRHWGFPVPEGTFSGAVDRYNGDLVEKGQGEVLVWA